MVNTNIPDEEAELRRRRKKRRKEQQALLGQQQADRGERVNIESLYNFDDIFATPEQARQYAGSRVYDLAAINEMVGTGEEVQSTQDINEENFLQLIAAADMNPELLEQEKDELLVDELQKLGITNPYAAASAESSDETTDRILQLYNRAKV